MRISINFPTAIGIMLLLLGAAGLLIATVYSSSVSALIGLGLILVGIIVSYIQSDECVKKTIFDSTSNTLLTALDETLRRLDYRGKAIYLPPKYLNDPQSSKVYISKLESGTLPSPDATQKLETQPTQKNAQGILITPPGTELARLFEAELGTSLLRIDLKDLLQKIPKTLIEDLEILTDCQIQTSMENPTGNLHEAKMDENAIFVKFDTTVYRDTCKQATQLSTMNSNLGCPLSSALAVALTKATGKPVMIKTQKTSEDGKTNEIEYTIVKELVT